MRDNLIIIRNELLVFLAQGLFLTLIMGLIFIDVSWMSDGLHENSFTEISQEVMLAIISGLFFVQAMKHPRLRGSLALVGGFYGCMLIREMDFLFDELHHGSWVWFALALALTSLLVALRHPARTLAGLVALLRHRAWHMMAAGLLTTLVFSRLFGMNDLWQHLMPDNFHHVVKNMAEEGSELLGYSLCLLSSVRYLLFLPRRAMVFATESQPIRWQKVA